MRQESPQGAPPSEDTAGRFPLFLRRKEAGGATARPACGTTAPPPHKRSLWGLRSVGRCGRGSDCRQPGVPGTRCLRSGVERGPALFGAPPSGREGRSLGSEQYCRVRCMCSRPRLSGEANSLSSRVQALADRPAHGRQKEEHTPGPCGRPSRRNPETPQPRSRNFPPQPTNYVCLGAPIPSLPACDLLPVGKDSAALEKCARKQKISRLRFQIDQNIVLPESSYLLAIPSNDSFPAPAGQAAPLSLPRAHPGHFRPIRTLSRYHQASNPALEEI